MGFSTFSGPLRVGDKDGAVGVVIATRSIDVSPQAVTNTDFVFAMPPRYRLLRATCYTTVEHLGGSAQLSIGTTPGGGEIVDHHNIKPLGVHELSLVSTFNAVDVTSTTLFLRVYQSSTPSAVGSATVVFEYIPLATQ